MSDEYAPDPCTTAAENSARGIGFEVHEFADHLPLMDDDEIQALAADIRQNGLNDPIWTFEGKILDGRNRATACLVAQVEPRYREFVGTRLQALRFVRSENVPRRHLTPSQGAAVALEFERAEAELVAEVREAARERQREGGRDAGRGRPKKVPQLFGEPNERHEREVDSKLAKAHGTNRQYVADIRKIAEAKPEAVAEIKAGTKTIPQVKKELRRSEREAKENAARQQSTATTWTITDDTSVVQCHALITDPPYGILDEPWEPAELERFTREWASRWNECGADLAAIFFSQQWMRDAWTWFDESLSNYKFQHLLVWHYPNNKGPQSRMGLKQTWEPIFLYRRCGSTRQIQLHGGQRGDGLNDFDCHVAAVPQSNFTDENAKVHPAQKPVSVMMWLANCLSRPGELVVDPFCGSGTTGIAAVRLGRRFLGIDTDETFREAAQRRIAAYGEQPDLAA